MRREILRLEASLNAAGEREKLVFLHYPPIYQKYECPEILELLEKLPGEALLLRAYPRQGHLRRLQRLAGLHGVSAAFGGRGGLSPGAAFGLRIKKPDYSRIFH